MSSEIISLPAAQFVDRAAELIAEQVRAAIAARGACRLSLAGGETPRPIYAALAKAPDIAWDKVWITFGDERCVGPEDPASNYRMASESLLARAPILPEHVLRIRGEAGQEQAALEYETTLNELTTQAGEARFVHDLILLGMGEDGHTASLFPGQPTLEEQERSVVPAWGPKPPPQRVSMTLPLLNAARQVFFIAKGADKAPMLKRVLAEDLSLPSARVQPVAGKVAWVVTEELAAAVVS